jgi:RimJ/RimL family protein N-acetyltransferase
MKMIKNFLTTLSKSPKRLFAVIFLTLLLMVPIGYTTYYIASNYYESTKPLTEAPKEIVGKVVTLKLLKEEFYIDYHNMWSNTARKALEFPEYVTLGYTIKYLQSQQEKAEKGDMLHYCIFSNEDKKLIGAVDIREPKKDDPGQLGCWVNEKYWGGGRFQEALDLISKTYFRLHPERKNYTAHVRLWNKRSYYALKKYGFKDAGFFKENGQNTRYILELERR